MNIGNACNNLLAQAEQQGLPTAPLRAHLAMTNEPTRDDLLRVFNFFTGQGFFVVEELDTILVTRNPMVAAAAFSHGVVGGA